MYTMSQDEDDSTWYISDPDGDVLAVGLSWGNADALLSHLNR